MSLILQFVVGAVGTTSGLDTSFSDIIAVLTNDDTAGSTASDNKGNTYSAIEQASYSGGASLAKLWVVRNPTVGAGHTFSTGNSYGYVGAIGFSGIVQSGAVYSDLNFATDAGVTSLLCGQISPSTNGQVILYGVGIGETNTNHAIDSGLTKVADVNGTSFVNYGGFLAYLIQTTAGNVNPTASWTSSCPVGAVGAALIPETGSGGGGKPWIYYAQQRRWRQQQAPRWERRGSLWMPRQELKRKAS